MKVVMNMVRNLTIRLANANEMNERQMLNIYHSLSPEDIERP